MRRDRSTGTNGERESKRDGRVKFCLHVNQRLLCSVCCVILCVYMCVCEVLGVYVYMYLCGLLQFSDDVQPTVIHM